jgi:tRNA pseudouridine55 synthase
MMGTNASILLVDKPAGITSFSSLNTIKRTVDPKVGHAGTLDKFARGLMIVLTGSMTKLNVLFSSMDKRYRATICFGTETDTLDPEGAVVSTAPVPSFETIKEQMLLFSGQIEQKPPQYSALHIGGKRASALARAGKTVEMAGRPVTIHSFEPVSFDGNNLVADVHVSKGTYIRSLARDLGLACGSRAYLVDLVRTQIGPFRLEEAVPSEDRERLAASTKQTDELMRRVPGLSVMEVADSELFSLANGRYPTRCTRIEGSADDTYAAVYDRAGVLRCILDCKAGKIVAQIHRSTERQK